MSTKPTIQNYMTPVPHTINSGLPLKKAQEMMREFGIRHLPVQVAGHLVGIITDRDVKLALSFRLDDPLLVDDVMTPDPFAVTADRPLSEVVEEMAKHKYGCAIVENTEGKVIGIFTATDALKTLNGMLRKKQPPKKPAKRAGL